MHLRFEAHSHSVQLNVGACRIEITYLTSTHWVLSESHARFLDKATCEKLAKSDCRTHHNARAIVMGVKLARKHGGTIL